MKSFFSKLIKRFFGRCPVCHAGRGEVGWVLKDGIVHPDTTYVRCPACSR